MYTNLAPPQPMPITVVTERQVIAGTVRTRRQRITDLLNDVDTSILVVVEATFTDLASGQVVEADVAQVPLSSILFAYARAETAGAPEMRTARRATNAVLLMGPYTIEGKIHLPLEADLKIALEEFQGKFVAVTAARYCAAGSTNPTEVDLVVVNHDRAFVLVSAADQPETEAADPLAPSDSFGTGGGGW